MRNLRKRIRATSKGYALISIIVISSFAMIFLMGLAAVFLSISRAEAVQNQKSLLVQAMDTGLDYAILNLNNHPVTTLPQEFDLPVENLPTLNPPITVRIRLTQLKSYAGGLDWNSVKEFSALNTMLETAPSANFYSLEKRSESWVLCELTASRGVFSRSARSILEPQTLPIQGMDYAGVGTTPPDAPLFPSALFANSTLNISPTTPTSFELGALDSALNPVLKTNNSTTLGPNTTVSADIESNNVTGDASSPATVIGQITSQAPPQNVNTPTPPAIGTSQTTLAPSPTMSVGNQMEFPASSTVNLSSASYSTSTLNLDGTNTVNLPSSPSSPTKIFVDPNSGSNVNINSNSLSYGAGSTPLDFQVFYNGSRDLTVTVSPSRPFNGLLYAPNANVKIIGDGNFNGAVVGNVVDIQNSKVNLQTSVSTTSGTIGTRNLNYGLLFGKSGSDMNIYGYQPVTWQEVSNKLVP